MQISNLRNILAAAATLVLAACGSSDIGDILGGPSGQAPNQIKGIVRSVDTSGDCRIELDNATNTSYLDNRGGSSGYGYGDRVTLYCDDQTRVVFQGQSYRPENLEAGDEVVAAVREVSGGRLLAERVDVTYDVSRGDDRYPDNRYPDNRYPDNRYPDDRYPSEDRYDRYGRVGDEDLRGTVRQVDSRNRLLILERVDFYDRSLDRDTRSDDLLSLYYDDSTRVTFRGNTYRPDNLEPGDIVAIDVDQVRGTLVADVIEVLADARDESARY